MRKTTFISLAIALIALCSACAHKQKRTLPPPVQETKTLFPSPYLRTTFCMHVDTFVRKVVKAHPNLEFTVYSNQDNNVIDTNIYIIEGREINEKPKLGIELKGYVQPYAMCRIYGGLTRWDVREQVGYFLHPVEKELHAIEYSSCLDLKKLLRPDPAIKTGSSFLLLIINDKPYSTNCNFYP